MFSPCVCRGTVRRLSLLFPPKAPQHNAVAAIGLQARVHAATDVSHRSQSRHVHVKCLESWRKAAVSPKAFYECSQCGYHYKFRRTTFARALTSPRASLLSLYALGVWERADADPLARSHGHLPHEPRLHGSRLPVGLHRQLAHRRRRGSSVSYALAPQWCVALALLLSTSRSCLVLMNPSRSQTSSFRTTSSPARAFARPSRSSSTASSSLAGSPGGTSPCSARRRTTRRRTASSTRRRPRARGRAPLRRRPPRRSSSRRSCTPSRARPSSASSRPSGRTQRRRSPRRSGGPSFAHCGRRAGGAGRQSAARPCRSSSSSLCVLLSHSLSFASHALVLTQILAAHPVGRRQVDQGRVPRRQVPHEGRFVEGRGPGHRGQPGSSLSCNTVFLALSSLRLSRVAEMCESSSRVCLSNASEAKSKTFKRTTRFQKARRGKRTTGTMCRGWSV